MKEYQSMEKWNDDVRTVLILISYVWGFMLGFIGGSFLL